MPKPDHRVEIEFSTGEVFEIDFSPQIARGGVFAALEDDATFQQLAVSPDGRYIEWPGSIDFCADALYERAQLASQQR